VSIYVIATAAGLAAAALGLALLGLWRAAVGQSAVERTLREGMESVETRVDAIRAAVDKPSAHDAAITGLKDDVSSIFDHLAALSTGHAELQKAVERVVGEAVDDLKGQLAETDKRAIARNEVLRDDQQRVSEQVEAATDHLTTTLDSVKQAMRDEIAPVLECSAALSTQIDGLGRAGGDAGAPMDADGLARAVAEALDGQADRLGEAIAPRVAAALGGGGADAAAALSDALAARTDSLRDGVKADLEAALAAQPTLDAAALAEAAAEAVGARLSAQGPALADALAEALAPRIDAAVERSAPATPDLDAFARAAAAAAAGALAAQAEALRAAVKADIDAALAQAAAPKIDAEALGRAAADAVSAAFEDHAARVREELRAEVEAAVSGVVKTAAGPRVFNTGRVVSLVGGPEAPAAGGVFPAAVRSEAGA
jgi:hypothetical protein